jgi:hypothetical protein
MPDLGGDLSPGPPAPDALKREERGAAPRFSGA